MIRWLLIAAMAPFAFVGVLVVWVWAASKGMVSSCGFCRGEPVGNAATWSDGIPRPPAPCPRCGQTTLETVDQVARKMLDGQAFTDLDAVRVAAAFLEATA